ncbi:MULTISPECIES: TRAP transporter large permease [unclassified Halomonas]|nr:MULTISPECIES: TRAP transporter large permease [unclassified Halomonas]KJZ09964.1 C4-dicarboxylate ABC transporter permease [Halomonas sp. S2151]MCJ8287689.1 TRAP transporter large permease [Halomonas sp.]MCO7216677.1 TRAP transporter large permease [Halomonas sp. OfavH-34-E]NQY72408.1 TRAP transporter large permease [Halomonas sp.]
MTATVLFLSLVVLLILNVPVGIAIGLSCVVTILSFGTLSELYVAQTLVSATDSFPIMAIPLFILAGDLMGAGGVSRRILGVASAFFGRFTGGLAIVTVVVCMFFAAVSGSGPATVAAVGSMVVPTMLEAGYSKSFVLALVAAAGSIGVIIPPSIPMVLYGVSTGTSISNMFLGGVLPGLLIGLVLITYAYFYSRKMGWKGDDTPFDGRKTLCLVWEAKWALLNPVIILGGIYAGIFTPTEAAAVAAVYAFVCGVFIHRELSPRDIFKTIAGSCATTGTVMVILGCASTFARILTIEQIPVAIADFMLQFSSSPAVLLLVILVMLLLVGCVMDTTPAILVLSPILYPVATSMGIDPVHFGIVMVVSLAIGFITPPLGINLFVASRIGNASLGTVIKGIVPFVIVMILTLLVIAYVPQLSLVLLSVFNG